MEILRVWASPEHHHCSYPTAATRRLTCDLLSLPSPFRIASHLVQSDLSAFVLLQDHHHPRISSSASPYPSLFGWIIPGVAVVAFSRLPFDSFSLPSLSLPTSPLSRNSWDSKRTGVYCSLARPLPLRRPTFPSSLLFRLVLLQRINLLLIRRLNRLAFLSRRYNTSRMEHHRMANC